MQTPPRPQLPTAIFFTTSGTKQSIRCVTDTRRKCCRTNMACKRPRLSLDAPSRVTRLNAMPIILDGCSRKRATPQHTRIHIYKSTRGLVTMTIPQSQYLTLEGHDIISKEQTTMQVLLSDATSWFQEPLAFGSKTTSLFSSRKLLTLEWSDMGRFCTKPSFWKLSAESSASNFRTPKGRRPTTCSPVPVGFVLLEVLQAASVAIETFAAVCGASYAAARTISAPAVC